MEIDYFFWEKLTKMFCETSEERFMLEMVTNGSLCNHEESSKFGNSTLFPIPWSVFERLSLAL